MDGIEPLLVLSPVALRFVLIVACIGVGDVFVPNSMELKRPKHADQMPLLDDLAAPSRLDKIPL